MGTVHALSPAYSPDVPRGTEQMPPNFHAGTILVLVICQTFVAPAAHPECDLGAFLQGVDVMAAMMRSVCCMLL